MTPWNKYGLLGLALLALAAGCEPRTPGQKVEDKAEDAAHETGQALERAGEKVRDAAN